MDKAKLAAGLFYIVSFAASFMFGRFVLRLDIPFHLSILAPFAGGLALLGLYYRFQEKWTVPWIAICAVFFMLLCFGVGFRQYGDHVFAVLFIQNNHTFNRWMLGTALQNHLFRMLSDFYFFHQYLPGALLDPGFFSKLTGMLVMGFGTLHLLKRYAHKSAVVFCTLTPIWLAFTAGYQEYYPLVTIWLVWLLCYIFYTEFDKLSMAGIGAATGVLACLYVAYMPLALMIFLFFAVRKPSRFIFLFLGAFLTFVVLCKLFYQSPEHFLNSLPSEMCLGETHMPEQYKGLSAAADSPFFKAGYALSWTHFGEVIRVCFAGGGLVFGGLLGYIALLNVKTGFRRLALGVNLLGVLLIAWSVFYLVFMIPKWGIFQDVDLFFIAYVIFAFFAGHLFDLWALTDTRRQAWFGGLLGNAMLGFYVLAITGFKPL